MSSYRRTAGAVVVVLLNLASPAIGRAAECIPTRDAAAIRQAEQKLVLLERLVGDTIPAQRVLASNNAEAERALAGARSSAEQAGDALDAGCAEDAVRLATGGLSLASRAFALAKNKGPNAGEKYEQLLARTQSFLEAVQTRSPEIRGLGEADLAGMQRQIDRARELAARSDFDAATDLLLPVADRLERRIVAIYHQTTVYYEKSFDSPADEYAYLSRQYMGYQLLFDRFAAGKPPPHSAKERYENLLTSAAVLAETADSHADDANWDDAIATIEDAINRCEQAMRLIGIGY